MLGPKHCGHEIRRPGQGRRQKTQGAQGMGPRWRNDNSIHSAGEGKARDQENGVTPQVGTDGREGVEEKVGRGGPG